MSTNDALKAYLVCADWRCVALGGKMTKDPSIAVFDLRTKQESGNGKMGGNFGED